MADSTENCPDEETLILDGHKYRVWRGDEFGWKSRFYHRFDENGNVVLMHNVVWQWYHGTIPKSLYVRHISADTLHNSPSNLTLALRYAPRDGKGQALICENCGCDFHGLSRPSSLRRYCCSKCNRASLHRRGKR